LPTRLINKTFTLPDLVSLISRLCTDVETKIVVYKTESSACATSTWCSCVIWLCRDTTSDYSLISNTYMVVEFRKVFKNLGFHVWH